MTNYGLMPVSQVVVRAVRVKPICILRPKVGIGSSARAVVRVRHNLLTTH